MNIKKIAVLSLITSAIIFASCAQQQVDEKGVLAALDSLEQKSEWLDYQISLQYWDFYTLGEADSLEYYQNLHSKLVNNKELLQKLTAGKNLLTNEEDKRRRDILIASMLYGQVEDDFDIVTLRDSLSTMATKYRAEFEGEKRSASYLYRLMRYDANRRRRESAYRAYVSIGDQVADGLEQLFRYRNQIAKKLGYNSFLGLVFSQTGLNPQKYKATLNKLEELSRARYETIVDNIKVRLDVDNVEYWDLHFGYADINRTVDRYFPADSQLLFVKRSLKDIGFNLDKLPIYFDLDSREGKTQFTFCFPVKPPHDVRVLGHLADGLYGARVLLHEIGHALHFTHIAQDREVFARGVDGSWTEGMAQIIGSLIYEKEWLTQYAKMPPELAQSYLTSMKEQDIIWLRRVLLLLDFEYEAYTNPNRDINKMYWDLFVKYMHLPKHEQYKPWAAITHYVSIPVYMQNYLYADMIWAQTFQTIRDSYGDPVNNPDVSAFLIQNYYRFGGRYDWRELLERGTGEDLNPEYLIKAYGL